MTDYEIGRATSAALVSVRTLLANAESALQYWSNGQPMETQPGEFIGYRHEPRPGYDPASGYLGRELIRPHPELDEMHAALEQVIELLKPWRRIGRPRKPANRSKITRSGN